MFSILINNEPLDLPVEFSADIEDTNPIFNDKGSQSLPLTVPATGRNQRLLGFPARIDTATDPNKPEIVATVVDGAYIRRGKINVTSAGLKDGITFNVGFDNSTAYSEWGDKRLADLSSLPLVKGCDVGVSDDVDGMIYYMSHLYTEADPAIDPLAVFPIAISKNILQEQDSEHQEACLWEMMNVPQNNSGGIMIQPGRVKRVIDGALTEVVVPKGYALSPFVRVWKLLELVFADLGVTVEYNIFRTNSDFARLVVLNNVADAICTGSLKYADLMPDCTVAQFMKSLWVRFGLVYNINFDKATVSLKLLRDIIKDSPKEDLVLKSSIQELINYNGAQYVKLSAKTTLEGAAPFVERFEDFTKGLDLSKVHLGYDVSQWTFIDDGNGSGSWDGDVGDFENMWSDDGDWDEQDPPDPDYPEPDDDRDDDRGNHVESVGVRSVSPLSTSSDRVAEPFLAREFITGNWYKIDDLNRSIMSSSSSFFNWDPATPALEAYDLASDDECVPLMRVDAGTFFKGICPAYLTGARHYHSYIKGGDNSDNDAGETPLAFAICYTKSGESFGRLTAEGDDGFPLVMDDGSTPGLSLLFQFKDGLFAKFWAGYDEILRHGNRSVELSTSYSVADLMNIDLLRPVSLRGVRCLIDNYNYSLPVINAISVEMTLRAIATVGNYKIREEQNIPDFSASKRHLAWAVRSDGFSEDMLTAYANKKMAANQYKSDNNYTPHSSGQFYYDVTPDGVVGIKIIRNGPSSSLDPRLEPPTQPNQTKYKDYPALLTYEIWESREYNDNEWERYQKLGTITITVYYRVKLVSRWVSE